MIKDKYMKEALKSLGFCKLEIGDKELIEHLTAIYQEYFPSNEQKNDMAVTHNNPKDSRAYRIHQEIIRAAEPYFNNCFEDYTFLASHFVVKKGQSNESFQLHQDWNVVDESIYQNHQVWIPLDVSYPENGGVCFIPESHLFYENYRSGSNNIDIPRVQIEKKLYPHLSYIRLFPGEAALFFSKTFHGSFINSTPVDRVAVLINIIEKKATPLYYHKNPENGNIDAYKVSTEEIFQFLPQLEKGILPFNNKPVFSKESYPIENSDINADALIAKSHQFNQKNKRSEDYEHKLFHIIKDNSLEKEINHKGFAVVDLLGEKEIELLKIKFNEVFPDRSKFTGTYNTLANTSIENVRLTHQYNYKVVKECLDKYFKDYVSPISLLYSRRPDKEFHLEWHSDPSLLLNEHIEPVYGVWSPLLDVDNRHGALKLVPGSHRLLNKISLAYKVQHWPLAKKREILEKYGVSFSLKAGQAIIFDARMIHSSEPNTSSIDRDNIVLRVHHFKSTHYFNITTEDVSAVKGCITKQPLDYFFTKTIKDHNTKPATGEKMGDFFLFYNDISDDEIHHKLSRYNISKKFTNHTV